MRNLLFTPTGLTVTLIHNLILIGAFGCWVFFQVKVLGNDLQIGSESQQSEHLERRR